MRLWQVCDWTLLYASLLVDNLSENTDKSDIFHACVRYILCLQASYVLAAASWWDCGSRPTLTCDRLIFWWKCTFKGQFIVSRRQILSHPKKRYQHLLEILQVPPLVHIPYMILITRFEAPKGHWIYDDPDGMLYQVVRLRTGLNFVYRSSLGV